MKTFQVMYSPCLTINRMRAWDWDGRKVISATYVYVFTGPTVAIVCGVVRTQWIGRSIVQGRIIVGKRRFNVPRRKREFWACFFLLYSARPEIVKFNLRAHKTAYVYGICICNMNYVCLTVIDCSITNQIAHIVILSYIHECLANVHD